LAINSVFSGFYYLIKGFGLITRPGLRRYVVIPVVINILFFTAMFFLLQHYLSAINQYFTIHLPSWLMWLAYLLWLLFFISFYLLISYAFVALMNVFAAPFNSLLAEKVDVYLTGVTPISRSFFEQLKDTPRVIGRQLAILGFYIPRALLLAILFFIPVVQVIAAPLWFLFNAWYITLTYVDYITDYHRIPLRDVRLWLKERRGVTLGFGTAFLIVLMIPGLNFFVIPAAVAGAAKWWIDESKQMK
jgi:CysZ protein